MKVVVTGGAGYIGSHTAVSLICSGHTPVLVDNFVNSERWIVERIFEITGTRPTLYEGDCCDRVFMQDLFSKEGDIDAVIHFAGHKAVSESLQAPLRYYRNNIDSLLTVLEVMALEDVRALVFSSSATVYGTPLENPIPETAQRQRAVTAYGATKAMCEDIIEDAVRADTHLSATALRYFNPVGAHESGRLGELPKGVPNNLVPYITQVAAGVREKLTVFGDDYDTPDGTCVRDFIHVMDLAEAHIAALEGLVHGAGEGDDAASAEGRYYIYNVGTGTGTSVRELLDTFERVNGVTLLQEVGSRRGGDIPACFADVSAIERALSWRARRTIDDALRDAWRWQEGLSAS